MGARAGVFGTASLSLPLAMAGAFGRAGGGGIAPPLGAGSLKMGIRELDAAGADATRCCRPGCRSVDPFTFATFGIFSFVRSLRVPSSLHGVSAASSTTCCDCEPSPELPTNGSTKICSRAFGLDRGGASDTELKTSSSVRKDVVVVDVEALWDDDRVPDFVTVVSPRTLRLDTVAAGCSGVGVGSKGMASIMRF